MKTRRTSAISEKNYGDIQPEQRLVAAILDQTGQDIRRGCPVATSWILYSNEFVWYCDWLGLNPRYVRKLMLNV